MCEDDPRTHCTVHSDGSVDETKCAMLLFHGEEVVPANTHEATNRAPEHAHEFNEVAQRVGELVVDAAY